MRTNQLKARAEEFLAEYDEEMIDELQLRLIQYLEDLTVDDVDTLEITDIVDDWVSQLPEAYDWAYDKVQSELDDIGDQKYQACKDEGIC